MNLTDTINGDIKKAMVAKEKEKLAALRAIKSELLLLSTSKTGASSNDEEIKVLQRMVKQRKESASIYTEQGREDLASVELQQADIIGQYLPEQLSEEDVLTAVKTIIDETGASSPSDMGKVMGIATKKLAGKADGKLIASATKSLLNK